MNIKILDSWLRENLKTKATPQEIAEVMSLKNASVERLQSLGKDYLYDIEITTNRVDMMSVIGIAREAAVALSSEGIEAQFVEKKIPNFPKDNKIFPVKIKNDPKLCGRICAAILEVEIDKSFQIIKNRLEASDIRSLNNVIDVTNYVMLEIGHPIHVFDFDRITSNFIIREAKKGDEIITLDKKKHVLSGGEIIADDGTGRIIDLLGIMGLQNSVVTDKTKKIMLFVNNNNSSKIRQASMNLNIRTEAAVLNEKNVDPELGILALNRGIQLLQETARGKLVGKIFDEYHIKPKRSDIVVSLLKIQNIIGVKISKSQVEEILKGLGFEVKCLDSEFKIRAPSYRAHDIEIPEDIIEEIARMYGYHKIPSFLPPVQKTSYINFSNNPFYLESRVKNALKYFGFTEVYTYSLVSEDMLEIPSFEAVEIANPLSKDMTHLRTTLIPSLLQALSENAKLIDSSNRQHSVIKIFELSNVYYKKRNDLPNEVQMLAGIIKQENADFYTAKGVLEALFEDLGIKKVIYKKRNDAEGAYILIEKENIGSIEVLSAGVVDFEINYELLSRYVNFKKVYNPPPKYPEAIEDLRIIISPEIEYENIVETIKSASNLVKRVELLDIYEDKKTFRVIYQSNEKNLSGSDISQARDKILYKLKKNLQADPA